MISCVGFRKASTQPTGDCDRTVDAIESATELNFFSNLPDDIEEEIEKRNERGLMSANLLAQANNILSEVNLNIEKNQQSNNQFFAF